MMAKKNKDDHLLQILVHILGLFTAFIGPLILFLVSKDKEVKTHAKVALNWQISFIIYIAASSFLSLLLIGFLLVPIFGVLNTIFCIIAAVKASEGNLWVYPLSIKFLK